MPCESSSAGGRKAAREGGIESLTSGPANGQRGALGLLVAARGGRIDSRSLIKIELLSYRYAGSANDALRELSLGVREGSLFGLLGPNGSGKTTLVSLLAGILPAPEGRIHVAGL